MAKIKKGTKTIYVGRLPGESLKEGIEASKQLRQSEALGETQRLIGTYEGAFDGIQQPPTLVIPSNDERKMRPKEVSV